MLKLSYEDITKRIKAEKGLSDSEIELRVNEKIKKLSNLVSREGAANIVANELGIKLYDSVLKKKFKVGDLLVGLRSVELVAKVMQKYEVREFSTEKRSGKVATLFVGDETGTCRLVMWDVKIIDDYFGKIKEGDVLKVGNAYVRENNGFKELHLGSNSTIELNPANESIGEVTRSKATYKKKSLNSLENNDFVEVSGTIVQAFEPKFYTGCPECFKKLNDKNECPQHGLVKEKLVPILNFVLDDGTETLRISLFRDNVEKLLDMNHETLVKMKDDTALFEQKRQELLGKQVSLNGKATKNEEFDTMQFNAFSVKELEAVEVVNEFLPK